MKIWECKVGIAFEDELENGADSPMRKAVEDAYYRLTGRYPSFVFSGWGAKLTDIEKDTVIEQQAMRDRENAIPKQVPKRRNDEH